MTQTIERQQNVPARRNGNGEGQRDLSRVRAGDTVTLKNMLEAQSDKIRSVLPKHLTAERLMRVALVAVSKSKDLQECTISSVLQCVMIGAQLGLDCSGVLGSAYMVAYWNKNIEAKEAQFIPGYRGLIDLARRSGEIDDIYAHCVYADDEFDLELGDTVRLKHKPNFQAERRDEDIIGAYMVAHLKGNTRPHVEFVPMKDIEKIRKSSKAKFGPWFDWFAEMCRKTAIRRGIKYLPVSVELSEALGYDNAASEMETEVHSASTQPRGVTAMANRLQTQRPLSEGQTLVDTETGEEIQTPSADESQPSNDQPESAGADDSNPDPMEALAGLSLDEFKSECYSAKAATIDKPHFETAFKAHLLSAGFVGPKFAAMPLAGRKAMLLAFETGRIDSKGVIAD